MSNPESDEVLYTYIAIAHHAVSLVLIRDSNGLQKLVYYVSKSLHETEVRYLSLEKAILAVVHVTRKLPHYFQAHTMVILTQLPLKFVLRTADYIRWIAIWIAFLACHMSLEMETPIQIYWPRLLPHRQGTCLELFLLSI